MDRRGKFRFSGQNRTFPVIFPLRSVGTCRVPSRCSAGPPRACGPAAALYFLPCPASAPSGLPPPGKIPIFPVKTGHLRTFFRYAQWALAGSRRVAPLALHAPAVQPLRYTSFRVPRPLHPACPRRGNFRFSGQNRTFPVTGAVADLRENFNFPPISAHFYEIW